jgi:hypothetical protein
MTYRTKFVLIALTITLAWALFFLWATIALFKADQIGLGIITYGLMCIGSIVLLESTRR